MSSFDLTDDQLIDFAEYVAETFYDLMAEKERRGLVAQRPAAVVAKEMKRLRARVWAHHELANLSDEAVAESLGGTCQICVRAVESVDLDPLSNSGLGLLGLPARDNGGETAE